MPTRSEIRAFGRRVGRGDVFVNRFREHGRDRYTRAVVVERDVARRALFVLRDLESGRITVIRSRTLMTRFVASVPGTAQAAVDSIEEFLRRGAH